MSDSPHEYPGELIEQVRAAASAGSPLRIVGGGTKSFLGEPGPDHALSVAGWSGVVSHEPSELVVTVRAGTPLAELEAVLAAQGQCLPFEPPRFAPGGTVGGMVAAGLAGPARASVGTARDYVLGARFINGRGEWLTFGGQVMKNVAGYDVSRALAGSRGRLGVITEVSLKVLPVAPAEATLAFALGQCEALEQLHRWGGQPLPLNASCWQAAGGEGDLRVRLRGAVAAVESACARLGGQRLEATEAEAFWAGARDQRLPFFQPGEPGLCLWRLSVPQTADVLGLPWPQLIEWQGAQRWLWAPASAAAGIRAAAAAARGHASLFRAAAEGAAGVPREDAVSPAIEAITRRLRAEFDPLNLFHRAA